MAEEHLPVTAGRAVVVAEALAEHHLSSGGRNLGQYRTEWTCACGETFVTDGHRGESVKDANDVHLAAAILAALDLPAQGLSEDEREVEYEYVLVIEEHGSVGIGPTTDRRAVEQDRDDWEAEAGKRGTIMRRKVNDWDVDPTDIPVPPAGLRPVDPPPPPYQPVGGSETSPAVRGAPRATAPQAARASGDEAAVADQPEAPCPHSWSFANTPGVQICQLCGLCERVQSPDRGRAYTTALYDQEH